MTKKPTKRELMAKQEAEEIALLARDTCIIEDYMRGISKQAIADKYHLSRPTIHGIICKARDLWKSNQVEDYDLKLTIELDRIDRIEAEAWDAYEKSKKPIVTTTRRTDGTRVMDEETGKEKLNIIYEEVKSQTRHPDPRYLNVVQWCTEQRLKIMGGYAPEKHAATTPDGKQYAPFSIVEVMLPPEPKDEPIMIEAVVNTNGN